MRVHHNCARLLALSLVGLFLSSASPRAPFPAPSSAPGLAPTAPRVVDDWNDWRDAFLKAAKVGAESEMVKLVKSNQVVAIHWIVRKSMALGVAPSDPLVEEMDNLRQAWKAAYSSEFANNMYEYHQLLESVDRDQRLKIMDRQAKADKRYRKNLIKKDPAVFGLLWGEFEGVAGLLSDVGDHYYSSQTWLLAYSVVNQAARGDDADLYKACKALKMVVAERAAMDLKDRIYSESLSTYNYMKAQGYDGDPSKAGDDPEDGGGPPRGGVVQEGAAEVATMSFELVVLKGGPARPSYYDDQLHNLWSRLSLRKKGSSTRISALGDGSPTIMRTGSAQAMIDLDGDGEGDIKVPLRGKIEPMSFMLGKGDEAIEWGFEITTGTQTDMYQGIQVNMIYDDNQMALYIHPAASMVGELGGVRIQVIDEDLNGVYGGPATLWGHDGLTTGQLHPEFDSIVIGDSKRALPWSEFQLIGETWYRLEIEGKGKKIIGFPVEVESGKIKLSFKGGKPKWLIVQGTGKYENSFFDLMDKNTQLPPGEWKLYCGELRKGKKIQTMKALILPGEGMLGWVVQPGATTKAELGGPFGFDFKFEEDGKNLTILNDSIVVVGRLGERYERPWNCVAKPLASYRKKGDKRGSKPQKFKAVQTQDEINEAGWSSAWFPVDLDITKKGTAKESEVQLTEKKNKLFGKVTSVWKE